jgi:uncharacterized membrane protein
MGWPEDFNTNYQFLLRWLHFLGGITWIGMLYFFNLVNVKFQKDIDASIKGKVNPPLLSRTLWWFRWGAVVTWVTGFLYYLAIAGTETPGHKILALLLGWVAAYYIVKTLIWISAGGGALKDGRLLAVFIAVVVALIAWLVGYYGREWGASSRSLSILIGGGLGTVMFMNVWMIIWPLQKKIIAAIKATAETGAAAPAEQGLWARRAFLASRTNAWLSVPMLFFMGAASHFPIFSVIGK